MDDLIVHDVALLSHAETNDVASRLEGFPLVSADLHVPPDSLVKLVRSQHWMFSFFKVLVSRVVD